MSNAPPPLPGAPFSALPPGAPSVPDAEPEAVPDAVGPSPSETAPAPRRKHKRISLRTRLVALVLLLLLIGSAIIGTATHATMSARLNAQLSDDLNLAAARAGTQLSDSHSENRGPSGVPPGTITGLVSGGSYNIPPFYLDPKSPDIARVALSEADARLLLHTARGLDDGQSVELDLDIGTYRVTVRDVTAKNNVTNARFAATAVVGIPTSSATRTLATLDLSMVLIGLGGTLMVGSVASLLISRTLRPLARVSAVASTVAEQPLERGDVDFSSVRVSPRDSEPGTEVGNVGQALNNLLDNVDGALEVRAASEERMRRFAADASHELRTPLAAVQGYSELLEATESLSEDGERSLERVREQTKRMATLVENLLLLSRLDENRAVTEQTPVDLTRMACDLCLDFEVAAPDHRWEFVSESDDPVRVLGDENQVTRVVQNLMSNARKHTSDGTRVTVTVGTTDAGQAKVTVHDTGEGISEDFIGKVFDRFARADAARSGSAPTTGLGLSIVKAIVEAHGGSISVTSRPGDTTFTVLLPLLVDEAQAAYSARP